MRVDAKFQELERQISVGFDELDHQVAADFGEFTEMTDISAYEGPFEVTPQAAEEVTIKTAQKFVGADITVLKIPYSEVSNNSGGLTANIGG